MTKRILIIGILLFQIISFGQNKADASRQITDIKVNDDGTIQWTSVGETTKLPYVIEQFRWNKWIKIGEVNAVGSTTQNMYSFFPVPYNGENLCRVRLTSSSNDAKEVKWTASTPKTKFAFNEKTSKIQFTDDQSRPIETMYEILDNSGTLVKKGWAKSVSYDNIPKGKYTLNYDNATTKFKR